MAESSVNGIKSPKNSGQKTENSARPILCHSCPLSLVLQCIIMQTTQQSQRHRKPKIRRRCKCGCNALFLPARKTQRFLNEDHRLAYYADAFVTIGRAEYGEFLKWKEGKAKNEAKKIKQKTSASNPKSAK